MRKLLTPLLLLVFAIPFVFAQGVGLRGTTTVGFAPNETNTGTTQSLLAKLVAGKAIKALTTDTAIPLYVVESSTATSGDAVYTVNGPTACLMDETNASDVSGQPVVASIITAGYCHVQASMPTCGWIVGVMSDSTTTIATTAIINAQATYSCPATGAGSGTATSVGLQMPAEFSTANTPVTTSGVLTVTKANAATNCVMAGPASGGTAPWACRSLVAADLPGGGSAPTGAAGGSLGGTYPNPTVVNAPGAFSLTGDVTPTTLTGNLNDAALTGFTTNTVIHINGGAADRLITGFVAGGDGEIKCMQNVGTTNAITLVEQSSSSTAANRLLLGGDVTLFPQQVQCIQYDTTAGTLRWRAFGAAILDAMRMKPCNLGVGSPDPNTAPLSATDAINDACPNDMGRDLEILTVSCMANNTGVVLTPILTGGTTTSILTGALTCGNNTWADGTVQAARPLVHSYSGTGSTCSVTPCSLGHTWTTTGLATEMKIKYKMRLR